jgi:serine/threonine-protein kinase
VAFAQEKRAEDQALREVGANPAGKGGEVPIDWVPTEKGIAVVPPTALAFEHRAVSTPASMGPSVVPEEVTELFVPGRFESPKRPAVSEQRVAFLETTGPIEDKVVKEIEADGDSEPWTARAERFTGGFDSLDWRRMLAIGISVFFGASAIGFLAIWLIRLKR